MATSEYFVVLLLFSVFAQGDAIACYQCDSEQDTTCDAGQKFDTYINSEVECSSFESRTPGHLCLKVYQESPGWGGWIKETRRCAFRSYYGVAWSCRWSWDEVGVFREECYCDDRDGCNTASSIKINSAMLLLPLLYSIFKFF